MKNRPIKFRAWDKKGKMMSYVQGIESTVFGEIHHVIVYIQYANTRRFHIDDVELMQFTGLLDKNGIEIWEGDILKTLTGISYEVMWMDKGSWNISGTKRSGYHTVESEVIGNVYQNPELLK